MTTMLRNARAGGMLLFTFVLWTGCASGGGHSGPPAGVDLTGTWVFNPYQSDDVASMMRGPGARPAGRPGAGPPSGGRPGGRPGARPGGGFEEMRAVMRDITQAPTRIIAVQTDTTVMLTYPAGRTVSLIADGQTRETELPGGRRIEVKAGWKDGSLRVERKLGGRLTIKERYRRAPGSTRLIIETEVTGGPRPMKFSRVYDVAENGGSGTEGAMLES